MVDPRSWFSLNQPKAPTSPTKPSGSWDAEKDTSALFCSHSIEEIRQIEQQTRLDIERRKEDLRQMVGERYRDLIDAADSIVDMKTCAEHVHHSVSTMEQLCQKLQQTHFLRGSGGLRGPPTKCKSHTLAAQAKLLMDTPDKIWGCLEQQAFLDAAQLFLFARHIYSQLQPIGGASAALHKLWHSTACFKDTILECCSRYLQSSEEEEGAVVQSLCALVLLEGSSPRQVFTQFLLARKAAAQAVFHPTSKQTHRSVKSQVCQLVHVIQKSLVHIAAIFGQRSSLDGRQASSLLLQTLREFTSKEKQDFAPSLPAAVTNEIPATVVHSSCEDWIATCIADVRQGVGQLLRHVTSVKSLSSIRDAVHGLLAQPAGGVLEGSEEMVQWATEWYSICSCVLGRELSIWDEFLRPLLLERAKTILSQLFSDAQLLGITTLTQLLRGVGSDPTLYTPDTHVSSHLWQEEGVERGGGQQSTLTLKARACTPSVYSFCQSFGEKLELIIHEASHYLPPSTQDPLARKERQIQQFPFNLYGDVTTMQEYLQQSTTQCISRFLESVDGKVSTLRRELEERQPDGHSHDIVDRLLLIGRICQSLTDCCPNLTVLSRGCRRQEARVSRSFRLPSHRKEAEVEKNLPNEILCQRTSLVYRLWAGWCAGQFGESLRDQLSAEMELNSLASTLAWEEITIAEEAESGKQVSSVIRVPAQTSVYVTSLLFALCQEISRVGGHAINRSVLLCLSECVLVEVLSSYESLLSSLSSPVPQECALQLLFNLKFTAGVLATPRETQGEIEARLKSLSEQLQSFVDPFDLDVFLPHLLRNLERQLARSTVLLGMLLTLKGGSSPGVYKLPPGSPQEKHIVIPLAPSMSRLPSLPISGQQQQPQPKHAQVSSAVQQPSFLGTVTFFHHL